GFSRPAAGATYAFVNETIGNVSVKPAVFTAKPDANNRFTMTRGADLVAPVFLDIPGTRWFLLPLRNVRLVAAQLTSRSNCTGYLNPSGLDPRSNCAPDADPPLLMPGATLEATITLEDADAVELETLGQTLCVALTGDSGMWGDSGKPI